VGKGFQSSVLSRPEIASVLLLVIDSHNRETFAAKRRTARPATAERAAAVPRRPHANACPVESPAAFCACYGTVAVDCPRCPGSIHHRATFVNSPRMSVSTPCSRRLTPVRRFG
jgi:hypothetical protein